MPNIAFAGDLSGTTIGVPADTPKQFNNTFQWQDNFSKVIGTHSIKFGGQFHYDQINDRNLFGENGAYTFDGSETNSDFVDFLIGAPGFFIQASKQILDSRSKYMGLYGQDSWRVTPNLTLNYGLRWEFSQPWYDTQGKIETLIPGKQSVLFPAGTCDGCTGAPTGWVVPGDPGVPKTLAPTQYHNFSPRHRHRLFAQLGLGIFSPRSPAARERRAYERASASTTPRLKTSPVPGDRRCAVRLVLVPKRQLLPSAFHGPRRRDGCSALSVYFPAGAREATGPELQLGAGGTDLKFAGVQAYQQNSVQRALRVIYRKAIRFEHCGVGELRWKSGAPPAYFDRIESGKRRPLHAGE